MSAPEPQIAAGRTLALSWSAFAGMFVFGIVMALLGAILPSLAERLRFDVADIGTLFLVMNFAMLGCSSVVGLIIDHYGMKVPLAAGALLVAGALAIVTSASTFAALLPAVLLLGIGGGALNAGTNTLIADLHDDAQRKSAALNLLGVFFGVGALLLPFAIGALIATFGVSELLLAAAALCALVGIYAAALRFPAPKQPHRLPVGDMPRFFRYPTVVLIAALLFFQSGVEFTLGGFISTYLTRGQSMSIQTASWILAAYWAAVIVARVVTSRLLLNADPYRVVLVAAVAACASASAACLFRDPMLASTAIVLTGLALSPIYPTVLGIAGSRFREHSGTVFGILFTIALCGGMLLPWVAGQLGQRTELRAVFAVVAVAFAIIAGLARAVSVSIRDQPRT
jgi:FHS family glucose/mannose:H+ symporter-like MFS transporter